MILKEIFKLIYFFLPAYFANMTPPIAKKLGVLKFLERPVDFNKKFLGQPIFGWHKTWRGVILAILVCIFFVFLQRYLFNFSFFKNLSLIDYQRIKILKLALFFSFGTVFGDLFSAFIKRRLNLTPGTPFLPLDQTNYVIGCFVFLEPLLKLGFDFWLKLFIMTFFLHIFFNRLGYILKIHHAKW